MGKGDQRSKRGKIAIGSFGRLRPRAKAKAAKAAAAAPEKKPLQKKQPLKKPQNK